MELMYKESTDTWDEIFDRERLGEVGSSDQIFEGMMFSLRAPENSDVVVFLLRLARTFELLVKMPASSGIGCCSRFPVH